MELQHFSHDHPLKLNDQAKDGDSSSIACHGCRRAVSGEAYECRQCDYVLHKSCAELPSKIIHFSHPQHPLTLLTKSPYDQEEPPQCYLCGFIYGFIYHCSTCKYDLDMNCVKLGSIVNHEGHEHTYTSVRSLSFTCGACEETGEGICYMCSTCLLGIHIDCASHPKTDSAFHNFNLPSTIESLSLEKSMLDLDPFSENHLAKKIKLHHFCHQHLLLYGDAKDKKDLYSIDSMLCTLCYKDITDGPIYSCDECGKCYIHKVCSEFPIHTRNSLHPMHLLVLKFDLSVICSLCNEYIKEVQYRCSSGCHFYLHPQCAFENTFQPKNHKHTFANFKPTLFTCDGCGVDQKTELVSCICTICQLHVHYYCNNAFPLNLTQRMHPHELKLRYSFEIDFEFADKSCKICSKKMNSVLCMYRCIDDACTYIAHAVCATSEDLVIHNIGGGETCDHYEGHNTLEANDEEIEMEQAITHFSHPHPLIISNDEPKVDEPPKICYGCVRPISFVPFYTCDSGKCTFFLHQQCFDLPKTIQHPLHHHPLVLKDFPDLSINYFPIGFQCCGCGVSCNGFAYACESCDYYNLDVGCGLFSHALKHESHDCTLTLISMEEIGVNKTCRACESESSNGFWCEECNFFLDLNCASLPPSVGHECPTGTIWYVKPIKLWYDCIEHVDGQYYCDMCAEPRGKNKWFYHCEDCHESIHPQCLLGENRIKYGDSYYYFAEVHSHVVCVAKKTQRVDPLCGTCGEPCKNSRLIFCPTCNIYFHVRSECFHYLSQRESKKFHQRLLFELMIIFAAAGKLIRIFCWYGHGVGWADSCYRLLVCLSVVCFLALTRAIFPNSIFIVIVLAFNVFFAAV